VRRLLLAALLAALALPLLAGSALAHPLGNYTVNRALAITVGADRVELLYLIDMAEIPAFSAIGEIDTDASGSVSSGEGATYGIAACDAVRVGLDLTLNGSATPLVPSTQPELIFPDGAGGLRTLRLACHMTAARPTAAARGSLAVRDRADDGHVGWREVIIAAGDGVRLTASDVPSESASEFLSAYPAGRLESPPDIRQARASFTVTGAAAVLAPVAGSPQSAPTADDSLARLVGGELSPALVLLAFLLAAGLGAAHALSPGHGKTLVAAYLVGSRGTVRQAMTLGLTVAVTHTAGVLVLGALVLVAGELFLPEIVIGWLTIVSGGLIAVLGAALLWKAAVARLAGDRGRDHDHLHDHGHSHGRGHSHQHGPAASGPGPALTVRSVALLGMAGGLVPSASALIVLLAAVTTGRLVFGLALIAAFGVGMAAVLGGLAVVTALARDWLGDRAAVRHSGAVRSALGLLPIGSGMLVLGIGLAIALGAAGRLG
jgi:nickel/cobalt exporter